MKRFQSPVFAQVLKHLDLDAVFGGGIKSIGLEPRLFEACPHVHTAPTCRVLDDAYNFLESSARLDGRLLPAAPLIQRWNLSYDIYSPRLSCFIEVDERQHFSLPRLLRLNDRQSFEVHARYPLYFWKNVYSRKLNQPARDLDPPHRDEQRTYLDEVRDRLPVVYGHPRTIRLDEYSLRESGLSVSELIQQALDSI